jgi:hypothetical protein
MRKASEAGILAGRRPEVKGPDIFVEMADISN